jgi:hypothetical protein
MPVIRPGGEGPQREMPKAQGPFGCRLRDDSRHRYARQDGVDQRAL